MVEKIVPLYDKILVKRVEEGDKTPGGLFIPAAAKEKAQVGKVISVGAGRLTPEGKLIPLQVKAGDTVFFGKYSGTEADVASSEEGYLVIREDEILGIISK